MSSGRKHPKYEEITAHWGGMRVREEFENRITNWLKAFPQEEHEFLLELLAHFSYYCEESLSKKVVELNTLFLNKYKLNANELVYTKLIKEFGTAHSDIFFSEFWLRNGLSGMAENNIIELLNEDSVPSMIVVVDDYSGTGDSLIKTIDRMVECNESVKESSLFFITLHMTESAKLNIEDYAKSHSIRIAVESLEWSDAAFKEDYIYNGIDAIRHKNEYERLYKSFELNKNYPLGYKEVSSLVSFYYNTPNNTLGLFWQDLNDFVALFKRDKKEKNTTLSEMQRQAKNRKKNRETKVVYGTESPQIEVILTYFLVKGKKFLVSDFVNHFGITSEQGDSIVMEMMNKGYLTVVDGKILPSKFLEDHMFKSRVALSKARFEENTDEDRSEINLHEDYLPLSFERRKASIVV